MNLKSLLLRSCSGLIYCGIIIATLFWGIYPFSFMMMCFGILASIELSKICKDITQNSLPGLILDCTAISFLCFSWLNFPLLGWIFVYICRIILELYLKSEKPIRCLAISLMTQIYIGLPLGLITFIADYIGLHFALVIFLMIWINDTGAYLIGSLFGKHRLFERISPKKSWEGFFGGLVFNLLAGWLFAIGGGEFWDVKWNVLTWLIFGALVTIFGTWGDLIESMIKRSLNLKDSGHIIPGHGGIMDRIDSLLLVSPIAFLFLIVYAILTTYPQPFI